MRSDCFPTSARSRFSAWLIVSAVLTNVGAADDVRHWAFRPLQRPSPPVVKDGSRVRSPIDRFVQAKLEANGLTLSPQADRPTLIRRVAFDLTGLPPTPDDIAEFVADPSPDGYERMIERYLASPSYGEKWGKWWLDVAGYADSNGYFQADSDRPLAFRYRDYVIRSLNADKPFDQFVREQIAGDELSGFDPHQHERHATPQMIELLEATHFLRNGIDGSGESDGNPEEVLIDRYTALEASQQILISSLLGLTIQCAKCHNHKFEPITQREYYQLQASLFPVFNLQKWLKPGERFTNANLPGEVEAWEQKEKELDGQIAARRSEFGRWVREHRPPAGILFHDDFDGPESTFAANWSNTAPGDDAPGGTVHFFPPLQKGGPGGVATAEPPAAVRTAGVLQIVEGGPSGDKWISTTKAFDWTPDKPGEWIQATFDVVDNKVRADEVPAARIAFFLALHDFNDNSETPGGNILIDGNPAGGAGVYVDYPGSDQTQRGAIGTSGFVPGKNFGARVTRLDNGKYKLEQIVDWVPEDKSLELTDDELPDGGFGFEFCCGRSFIVDNVLIESSSGNVADDATQAALKKFREDYDSRRKTFADAVSELQKQHTPQPGKIAWASDVLPNPPEVRMLVRGNVMTPGELVQPATFRALTDDADSVGRIVNPSDNQPTARTTGRRLALADWLTRRDSRVAALMARVQVNRIWQQYFSRGIVATVDNLGVSSAPPSHPELLQWLASEIADDPLARVPRLRIADSSNPKCDLRNPKSSAWSLKQIHRLILTSSTYRQTSTTPLANPQSAIRDPQFRDPDNHWLWRAPMRRLSAEAIRDGMLFVSGGLDRRLFGPYVPTTRTSAAEVVVDESLAGARRRSLYLQQRRTQTLSLLSFFDAPSIVSNCVQRPTTTMPLQSLSLLNSEFALSRARAFATRLEQESPPDPRRRARFAFELSAGRLPTDEELRQSLQFLEEQTRSYEPAAEASQSAWADFCQMLLAANGFLYVE